MGGGSFMATNRAALTEADLRALLKGRSAHERSLVAHRLCSRMLDRPLSDEDRAKAQEILRVVATDACDLVRRALATTLRNSALLPRDVALRLARDLDHIAEPVLSASPAFTDEDLIEIVRLGDPIRRLAVARRPFVSEPVSRAIIETGAADAVEVVCSNDNAVVPGDLLRAVMDRFARAERVLQAVAYRRELPLDVTEHLIRLIGQDVGERIARRHELAFDTALQIASGAVERATVDLVDEAGRTADLRRFAAHLHAAGGLSASLLLRALAQGQMRFFEHGLAELAGLPHDRTWLMVHDAGALGLKAVYERAGLPARLFPAFRAAVDIHHALEAEGGLEDRNRFQARMLERFLSQPQPAARVDVDYLMERLDALREAVTARTAEVAYI